MDADGPVSVPAAARRRSRRRAALYVALGLLVAALGFIVLGWFPQEPLRRVLETRLREGLGPGSSVRRLHVVPGKLRTEVTDLVIEGPAYRLEVPRARVIFSPGFFWGRSLSFREIVMEGPRLTIRPDPRPARESQPLRKPLLIRRFHVTGGTVTYAHPTQGRLVLRGVEASGGLGTGALQVASTGGVWEREGGALPAAPLEGRLQVSTRLDIAVIDLRGGLLGSTFNARGSLGRVGALRPDLHVEASVDLADLARFDVRGLRGRVATAGHLGSDERGLGFEADLEGTRLDLAGWPVDHVTGHVVRKPAEDEATSLALTLGLLGGKGELEGTLRGGHADARVALAGIDVDRLQREGVGAGIPMSGRVSGEITARGDPGAALDVHARLRGSGAAYDMPLRLQATASGRVRARQKAVDLAWTAAVDASKPGGRAVPRLESARLTARGSARGAWPPDIQARVSGTVAAATRGGRESLDVQGTARTRRGEVVFDLGATGGLGALRSSGEARGRTLRRLALEGTSLRLDALAADTEGRATFRFDGSGAWPRLSGSGSGHVEDLTWRGARMGDTTLRVTARGGRADLAFDAPEVNASGTGRLERGTLRLTADLAGTPLAALQPVVSPDRPLEGQATGTVTATVPLSRPAAATVVAHLDTLDVTSGEFTARVTRPFTLTSENRRISVPDLALEGDGFRFEGSGRFGTAPGAPLDLRGELDVDLARLPPPQGWSLRGRARGHVELTGTVSRPRAAGLLALTGASLQRPDQPAVLSVEDGRVELAGDSAIAEGLRLQLQGGTVELSGRLPLAVLLGPRARERLALDVSAPLDVKATVDLDLASLPPRPDMQLSGRLQGDLTVTGTVDEPRTGGVFTVQGVTVKRTGVPPITVTDGEVRLTGDVATTDGVRIELAGGTVDLSGQVPLAALVTDPGLRARLGIDPEAGLNVHARLNVDLAGVPTRPGWALQGRAEGELSLTGSLAHPHGFGFVVLRGASLTAPGAPLVASADGRIDLDGDVASTSGVTASVAGGTMTLTGSVPLATLVGDTATARLHLAPGDTQVHLVWSGVQAAALQEALRRDKPATLSGTLSGEARLDGNFDSIDRVRGEVVLPRTAVRIQDLELRVEPLTIALDAGRITANGLTVTSEAGTFRADGQIDLKSRTVDAEGHGQMELRTLSPFLEEASLTGTAQVDLAVAGPLDAPRMNGTVQVSDGTMRVREFPQALTAIRANLTFDGQTVRVADTSAILGGGTLNVWGTARVSGFKLGDVTLTLAGKDMGVRYPVGGIHRQSGRLEDIKTRLDAELTFTGRPGDYILSGDVKVQRGLYDADIFPGEGLLAPETPPAPETEPSAFQRSVALDVTMSTTNPFYVRNNLAQLEATGTWRVRGDLDEPAPFGRLEISPGGKVYLQEREFTVTSGSLIYNGTKDPDLDVRGETLIPRVDEPDIEVIVAAQGTLDFPQLQLSSSPPRSEKELASLITTGRPDVGLNSGAWIVGEQAATLLTGRFTREVSRSLRELGFDQVNIQPELLAREDDPGARFTVGKDLTSNVSLVYSLGLNTPEAQYYAALFRFHAGSEITLKALRTSDGTITYGAGQRLRFGGPPRPSDLEAFEEVELSAVTLQSDASGRPLELGAALPEARLRGWIKAKPGKKTTYWDLLNDGDRLREKLVEAGHLEAIVEPRLEGDVATFVVQAGAHHIWRVKGMDSPPDLGPDIREALFDEEALERGRRRLLDELRARGHLRAAVEARDVSEGSRHALLFNVTPGPRLTVAELSFPGAEALSASKLADAAGGPATFVVAPKDAERAIREIYRSELYLLAEAGPTSVAERGGEVRIVVPVKEGPRAVVRDVRFEGVTLPEADLRPLLQIEPGDSYDRIAVNNSVQRVRDHYLKLGYPSVRVVPSLEPKGADLDVVVRVVEGDPVVAGPVTITGLRRTRESLVRRQINIEPGDPLDPRKMAELERRLLDLGIFRRAVVTAPSESPAPITIELEEEAPYRVAYDLRYNETEGFSALLDGELGNLFGTGVALGGRYRFGQRVRDERASLHIPSIGYGDLTATVFNTWQELVVLQEEAPGAVGMPNERTTERGFLVQQARHRHPYDFLYGYRRKRVTETFDLLTGGPRESNIGALDASVLRDTRENPLNAHRGTFLSLNVAYGPEGLGSDVTFSKAFAQAFFMRPVGAWLTWAQGYRLGLAGGLADDIFVASDKDLRPRSSERFRAGGANSLRGYATDSVGPTRTLSDGRVIAAGGQAVIILNQELRYQHGTGLGAVVFYDGGNVFESVSDFKLDLRHTLGVGLRYDSIVGLLRVDIGFPLNRREGDRSYRVFFGLGQAF
jgi:outer membrane protein assembly factor BamA/autotransporter translocation and assembly factor TamB